MSAGAAVAGAVSFVWLGMVLAISFLETPLKFRAPGVTIPIGLAVGRIIFRALNVVEVVLGLTLAVTIAAGAFPSWVLTWFVMVAVVLVGQLAVIRPRLNRRSDRVLAGENLPRSRVHLAYIALEVVKAGSLIALGSSILTG
ncbi:hypothetical protein [Actinophytocola sp.]|uniref:hypothetical protein n=1 Tax=Actinophytocola sp. TaxID=1872138 RepID=UPI003D6A5041